VQLNLHTQLSQIAATHLFPPLAAHLYGKLAACLNTQLNSLMYLAAVVVLGCACACCCVLCVLCLLLCAVCAVPQVHGKLAASPSKPEPASSAGDMLRLMREAAQKPILWYLTLMGFLVGATAWGNLSSVPGGAVARTASCSTVQPEHASACTA
jgi:hypothetical protein